MSYEFIRLEKSEGVGVLTVNRPQALNALNSLVLAEIKEAVAEVASDDEIQVLIITGAGEKAFVAGADIAEMKDKSVLEAQSFAAFGQGVFADIENLEKPVIAAVNGYALGGGCELALACDIRLASEKARLGQPEVSLGVTPGWGGTQRLARLVGMGQAKELIFTGDVIEARTAQAIGLIDEVYAPEELLPRAKEMAKKVASRGQIAVRLAKLSINRGLEMGLADGVAFEAEVFGRCFATEDQKEGMGAFLEKRRPEFKGK